jgi:hypothetical protein
MLDEDPPAGGSSFLRGGRAATAAEKFWQADVDPPPLHSSLLQEPAIQPDNQNEEQRDAISFHGPD